MGISIRLDGRLSVCAKYVRRGAVLADIGTDHAYLPAVLAAEGRIARAIAADIGEGPCENAEKTIKSAGLGDMITVIRTDGLRGVERYSPTDIVIAGMGGETIMSILSAADWLDSPDIRLILQPMTRQADLWRYLCENGYEITATDLAEGDSSAPAGKIYEIVVCSPGGGKRELSDIDAALRLYRCAAPARLQRLFAARTLSYLDESASGLAKGKNTDPERLRRLDFIRQGVREKLESL